MVYNMGYNTTTLDERRMFHSVIVFFERGLPITHLKPRIKWAGKNIFSAVHRELIILLPLHDSYIEPSRCKNVN